MDNEKILKCPSVRPALNFNSACGRNSQVFLLEKLYPTWSFQEDLATARPSVPLPQQTAGTMWPFSSHATASSDQITAWSDMQEASGEKNGCLNMRQNWNMECRRFFDEAGDRIQETVFLAPDS